MLQFGEGLHNFRRLSGGTRSASVTYPVKFCHVNEPFSKFTLRDEGVLSAEIPVYDIDCAVKGIAAASDLNNNTTGVCAGNVPYPLAREICQLTPPRKAA
ncbi:hypothetical protein NKDENANG_01246 [Candidatus Entotheonellaceae bacterium PAL068K]